MSTTLNSYTLGTNIDNLRFISGGAATNSFTGTGNALDNGMLNGVNSNNFSYTLDGGAGNDHLAGGAGNDSLTGGTGNDVMEGLSGNDSFKFAANFGSDIITDFGNHTTGNNADLLDLSGLGITALTFTSSVGIARFGTSDTMVTVLGGAAAGGTIKLKGVNFATINQTDFRLA
jgi:Ca2+-binding RTX toxin-like protein